MALILCWIGAKQEYCIDATREDSPLRREGVVLSGRAVPGAPACNQSNMSWLITS